MGADGAYAKFATDMAPTDVAPTNMASTNMAATNMAATKSGTDVTTTAMAATATAVAATTTTCQYVSRNCDASQHYRGNENRDSVGHELFHWTAFLFELTSPIAPAQVCGASVVVSCI